MPYGGPRRRSKRKSLVGFIDNEMREHKKLNELSTDGLNLLNLLTLIVDIEYRYRYGKALDWQQGKGYKMNTNEVLADQLPPVDDNGSSRLLSTGDNRV